MAEYFFGTGGRIRTDMRVSALVFETRVYSVPPHPHILISKAALRVLMLVPRLLLYFL